MVMNVGFHQLKVHLGFQIQFDPMAPLHPPRVYVGIASLGLTRIPLATWRIHNRFEPSLGPIVPLDKGWIPNPRIGCHYMR